MHGLIIILVMFSAIVGVMLYIGYRLKGASG